MAVHPKARLLKMLSHELLMNNFLESPFETFALTPAELTQLIQASFRDDIEPAPAKGNTTYSTYITCINKRDVSSVFSRYRSRRVGLRGASSRID